MHVFLIAGCSPKSFGHGVKWEKSMEKSSANNAQMDIITQISTGQPTRIRTLKRKKKPMELACPKACTDRARSKMLAPSCQLRISGMSGVKLKYPYSEITVKAVYLSVTGWWLGHPSEKYDFVNWDDEIPNIWENI